LIDDLLMKVGRLVLSAIWMNTALMYMACVKWSSMHWKDWEHMPAMLASLVNGTIISAISLTR